MSFTKFGYIDENGEGTRGPMGPPGANGISIQWLGSLASPPGSPTLNQGYYNTTDKKSYIWDGNSWEIIAENETFTFPVNHNTEASSSDTLIARYSGNTQDRFQLKNDGIMSWGSGSAAQDTFLYRNTTNTLSLGSTSNNNNGILRLSGIRSNNNSDLTLILANTSTGNATDNVFTIDSSGQMGFATTGSNAARDLFLRRGGTSTLNVTSSSGGSFGGTIIVDSIRAINPIQVGCGPTPGNTLNNSLAATTIITSRGVSLTSTGDHQTIINSSAGTISSNGNRNMIINSAGGTISGSSSNIIQNARTGNSTISGTCVGVFIHGSFATVNNQENVVCFSDSSATSFSVGSSNIFQGRFSNGYYLATNSANSLGVQAGANATSWSSISDERTKNIHSELEDIDLNALDSLRLYQYTYKDGNGELQFGPTAQSFYNTFPMITQRKMKFNCGKDSELKRVTKTSIADGDDVLLLDDKDEKAMLWACIKALNKKVSELEKIINTLKKE